MKSTKIQEELLLKSKTREATEIKVTAHEDFSL
jgi:hypothetical protein